ncbi:hypothetical protein BH09SUM1_BH09SUM1_18740 [soil metagenome]
MRAAARVAPVIIATAIFLISIFFARGLRIEEDVTSLLPDNNPATNEYVEAMNDFHLMDTLLIEARSAGQNEDSQQALVEAADSVNAALLATRQFESIQYRQDGRTALAMVDTLTNSLPALLTPEDLDALAAGTSEEALTTRLGELRRRLQEPEAIAQASYLQRDPLGIMDIAIARIRGGIGVIFNSETMDGRIWNSDQSRLLMVTRPNFPAMDTHRGAALMEAIDKATRSAEEAARGGVTFTIFGGHAIAADNAETIKRDIRNTVIAINIALLCLGILTFRRRWFCALALLPAAFGITLALGVFGLFHPLLSGIAIGCGASLVGITVEYGLNLLHRIDNTPEQSPRTIVRRAGIGLLLAAGTTIAAFLTLPLSSIPGQRQLGIFSAVGVLGSILFAVFVLPALIASRASIRSRAILPLNSIYASIQTFRASHTQPFYIAVALIACASVLGMLRLKFDNDFRRLNYLRPDFARAEEQLKETWGSFGQSMIVVEGDTLEKALQENDRVLTVLKDAQTDGLATTVSSIAPILPSAETQKARAASWKSFWNADRVASLRSSLAKAGAAHGFRANAFDGFLRTLEEAPPPLTVGEFRGTPMEETIRFRVREERGRALVATGFDPAEGAIAEIVERIRKAVPDARVLDSGLLAAETEALTRAELRALAISSGLAVALFILLVIPRPVLVAAILAPIVCGIAMTLGILGLAGVTLNVIGAVFIVYVFGVGTDYCIFIASNALAARRGEDRADASAGGSVLLCATATCCGFLAMMLGRHPAIHSIGLTGFLGAACSMLCAVTLGPPIVALALRPAAPPREGRNFIKGIRGLYRHANLFAENYVFWKTRLDPIFRSIETLIPSRGYLVDIGSGYGIIANIAAWKSPGRHVTGIDANPRRINVCRIVARNTPSLTFIHGDMRTAEIPAAETIVMIDCLHYVEAEDQRAVLARVAAALRPGGVFIFRDHMVAKARDKSPGRHFRPKEFYIDACEECGLSLREEHPELGLGVDLLIVFEKTAK